MPELAVPAGLVGTLAVVAFILAVIGALAAPVVARSRRYSGQATALALVRFAILTVAAILAATSAALGTIAAERVGVREVTTAALAVICLTPVIGAVFVRLRYGPTGGRTFHQQIAGNRVSSMMLIAILFEILLVTGFLIGAAIGVVLGTALMGGLVAAAISLLVTVAATSFALRRGDRFVLDIAGATVAASGGRQGQLRNVVAEMALAANVPMPQVYVISARAPNAFAVARDTGHASLAVTSGLLETLDREEFQGVVAHELAHVANLDSRHGLLVALLVGAVVVLTDVFFEGVVELARNPVIDGDSVSSMFVSILFWAVLATLGIAFAATLRLFAPLAARAVQAAVSRDREYLADATSVAMTRNPAGLVGALRKIDAGRADDLPHANRGTQHLWIVNPLRDASEGGRGWFDTHPATEDRITRLRALTGDATGLAAAADGGAPASVSR